MADHRVSRREGSYGWRLSIASVALAAVSCANLLDLPSDPRLAEPTVLPESVGPANRGGAQNDQGSGPAALLAGDGDDAGDRGDPASVGSGTLPSDEPASEPAPDGTDLDPIEAPADAGAPPRDEPEAPPAACPAPEALGPTGRCFLVVDEPLSWDDARLNCQARDEGWDLAAIRSSAVNDFIGGLSDAEAWLGGSDAAAEATWRWVNEGDAFWSGDGTTGSAVDGAFDAWNSNEPNGRGNSDCARTVPIVRTGAGLTWADLECFELRASLCEGPPL